MRMKWLVGSRRLERRTFAVSRQRSNQLSYEPKEVLHELGSYGQCLNHLCTFQSTYFSNSYRVKVAL